MSLVSLQQWLAIAALLIGIANAVWTWLSRPARDTNKRVDETNERVDDLIALQDARADRHREDLKNHDRRIQKVEDEMRHLPTKDDLHRVGQNVTAMKTELDIVARTITRIDDFLRKNP